MPGLEEEDCYFGAIMENRPMEWNLKQAQKRSSKFEIYKQAKKTIKLQLYSHQQSSCKDLS